MKGPGWIRVVTMMQLLYALVLIAFSLHLLALAYRWGVRLEGRDAVRGLIISSVVLSWS